MLTYSGNQYYNIEQVNEVLYLQINFCLFLEDKTFQYRDELIETIDLMAKDNAVKIVVITNNHPDYSLESYAEKWNSFFREENYQDKILRSFRVFDQLVLKLYALKKIVVTMFSEAVPAMVFNFGLVADLRIVSKEFYIDNHNTNMVNIPKGNVMLNQFQVATINPVNLYFLTDKIFHESLSTHHLVDKVFNAEELQERTDALLKRFEVVNYAEIEAAKMFKSVEDQEELENQLQQENTFLLSCIREKVNYLSQKLHRFH